MNLNTMPGHLIRRLHQISTAVFTKTLKDAGVDMTSVQFAALSTLQDNAGIDQATLAHLIAYDRATMGGVIDRLNQKGWVRRETNPDDRRARNLWLTADGAQALDAVSPLVETLQETILDVLSEDERAIFIALAQKAVTSEGGENHDGFDPSR